MKLTARINIGLRHVLLLYPWAILASGKAAVALLARRRGAWILAGLVAVAGLEVAMVAPHYLAFFNQLAGGPAQGPAYLVDSNLDWGQDLKGLKRWTSRGGPSLRGVFFLESVSGPLANTQSRKSKPT